MKRFYPALVFLAVGVFVCLSAWSTIKYTLLVGKSWDPSMVGKDMVSDWDRRLRKLRPDLPSHGVVGYLADWDIAGRPYGQSDQSVEYILTQYALTPLVLQRNGAHDLIVGNFTASPIEDRLPSILEYFGVTLIKAHTNEILLLKGPWK